MSRILYGVMGDARGHVARALTVAQEMPHHEFLFLGGGKVQDIRIFGYNVHEIPMLATYYINNKVDMKTTLWNASRVLLHRHAIRKVISSIVKDFDPDIILTDYEYFTPLVAMNLGLPCVSIDHQHILTHCHYQVPHSQRFSRFLTCSIVNKLYSFSSEFLIISFYNLPPKNPETTTVFPPLIRKDVQMTKTSQGDHVLVYQTSPTFHRLFPILEKIESKFLIYGFGARPSQKNLVFKENSSHGFLEDLATARYAITNGGHNVLCEAIYLGKPVLAFPIANAYEQFLNSYFLSECGYGGYSSSLNPSEDLFLDFERHLDEYKSNINHGQLMGNERLVRRIENLISTGRGNSEPSTRIV
jgi:uncharacterized protein (TIGR00661 family)